MQSTDFGQLDDLAGGTLDDERVTHPCSASRISRTAWSKGIASDSWHLGRPGVGRVLAKAEVGSSSMIVGEVLGDDAVKMPGVEHHDVIETLAPDGADQALGVRILPS